MPRPQRPVSEPTPAFPWIDTTRPTLLDTMIGLDDLGFLLVCDGKQLYILGMNDPRKLPDWLEMGLRCHKPELIDRMVREQLPVELTEADLLEGDV